MITVRLLTAAPIIGVFVVFRECRCWCERLFGKERMIRRRQPLSVYWPETIETALARYPSIAGLRAELCEAGFIRLGQRQVASRGWLTNPGPYRAKVFSCLDALPEEFYQQGLARLA